jgi:hypothetical protein
VLGLLYIKQGEVQGVLVGMTEGAGLAMVPGSFQRRISLLLAILLCNEKGVISEVKQEARH